jgi:hypothetical protein
VNQQTVNDQGHRRLAGVAAGQVVFAAVFVFLLLSAFHQPAPHALPTGVVATPAVTRQLQAALDAHEPGEFDLRSFPDAARARLGVISGDVDGAIVVAPRDLRLLTAGAGGIGPVQALTGAFDALVASTGQQLSVVDVVPPLSRDSEAFSVFFVILGVLFPSLVTGFASSLLLKRSRLARRVGMLVAVAVVIGVVSACFADGVAGLGNYLAIAGIVALFSLAISAPTAALARIKPAAAVVALLIFVVFGIPASGGPGNLAAFAPGFVRVLDPALPLGVAVDALRSAVYFHGHDAVAQLGVLAVWAAAGIAALILVLFRQRPKRTASGHDETRPARHELPSAG